MPRHLFLFDIDGTLLRCGPQVRPLFVGALKQVFGDCADLEGYHFAGKTDPMITRDLIRGTGLKDEQILPRLDEVREIYTQRLEAGLDADRMCRLPGVVELLDHLHTRADVLLGLVTGNWQTSAEVKLARLGLNDYFDFGAFGDDGLDRRDLPPKALERASRLAGRNFRPDEVLVIGDTVLDVDCAQASGLRSMAVATGFTAATELAAAGADWVFSDLLAASRDFPLFSAAQA